MNDNVVEIRDTIVDEVHETQNLIQEVMSNCKQLASQKIPEYSTHTK